MPSQPLVRAGLACLLITALASAQNRAWFHAPILHPADADPPELLFDVDGDGDIDAIGLDDIAGTYTVFTNDGFGNLDAAPSQSLGYDFDEPFLHGDFNGDGQEDLCLLVVGALPNVGFLIVPGQPGNTFGAPVFVQTPSFLFDIGVGDADGDAFGDVYVRQLTPGVGDEHYWLHGSASLTFTEGTHTFTAGSYHLVHDEDGDGLDDVISVQLNVPNNTTFVIRRTTPNGIVPVYSVPLQVWGSWSMLDWDGDGQDEIVSQALSTGVIVIEHTGGQVWTPTFYTVQGGNIAGGVYRGDWDGDGTRELITSGDDFQVFEDLGNGSFGLAYEFFVNAPPLAFGAGPADLDGDGNLDFVAAMYTFHGDGTLTSPFASESDLPLADWDNDGDLDAVGSRLLVNDGTGELVVQQFDLPNPFTRFYGPLVVTDFDGDGLREMLARAIDTTVGFGIYDGLFLLREDGDGAFEEIARAAPAGVPFAAILLDDVDADGDLDLLTDDGVFENDGSEFFTQTQVWDYWPVALADVDGDGDRDLLAVSQLQAASAVVLERTTPGVFAPNVISSSPGTWSYGDLDVAFVDVDDDGDQDVVTREVVGGTPQTAIFTNQGGAFSFATTIAEAGRIAGGDFDGDGLTDLAIGDDTVVIRRRQGPGLTYDPPVELPVRYVEAAADIDQDGDVDLIGSRFGTVLKNRRFHGDDGGQRRQYGEGSLGQGNRRPILSFTGALRELEVPSIRVRNIPGGTFVVMVLGSGEFDGPSPVLPDVQSYVDPVDVLVTLQAGGPLGVAGAGELDVPLPLSPGLAGARLYWEALVFDTSVPFAITHSNGCESVIGQ